MVLRGTRQTLFFFAVIFLVAVAKWHSAVSPVKAHSKSQAYGPFRFQKVSMWVCDRHCCCPK
jgi:hypothetical protein